MVLARPDRARDILHRGSFGQTSMFSRRARKRPEALLPGRRSRVLQVLAHRLLDMSPLMRLVLATLATLLIVGIAVFAAAGVSGPDSFFFTIVVLTGGYGDLTILQAPTTAVWIKFVASLLTILGAALVGLVYGAVTEGILAQRVGAILAERKVPRADHVIVCGLGNIGMRVVEELHRMDISVVAIERNHDNKFIEVVRRMKIPVIVANAAAPGVLHRAHADRARCVVGATDDDLVNLDVALAARALHEQIRIVLRIFDPSIAIADAEGLRSRRHLQRVDAGCSGVCLRRAGGQNYRCVSMEGQFRAGAGTGCSGRKPIGGQAARRCLFAVRHSRVPTAGERLTGGRVLRARGSSGPRTMW